MSQNERVYALTRIASGDYICPSNDGRHLWRFQRYIDGHALGLDVSYEERDFWRALRLPMPDNMDALDLDDLLPCGEEHAQWLPTRRAAINVMLGNDG